MRVDNDNLRARERSVSYPASDGGDDGTEGGSDDESSMTVTGEIRENQHGLYLHDQRSKH